MAGQALLGRIVRRLGTIISAARGPYQTTEPDSESGRFTQISTEMLYLVCEIPGHQYRPNSGTGLGESLG